MIASPAQQWRGRDPRTPTARRRPSAPGTAARATIQAVRRELSAGGLDELLRTDQELLVGDVRASFGGLGSG
jgi:hypothetical protein